MRIDVSSGLWLRCWTTAAKRAAAIASLERHPGVNQPSSLVTPSNYGSSLSLSCTLAHWPLDKYVVISRQTIATYVSAGGNTRTGVRACVRARGTLLHLYSCVLAVTDYDALVKLRTQK